MQCAVQGFREWYKQPGGQLLCPRCYGLKELYEGSKLDANVGQTKRSRVAPSVDTDAIETDGDVEIASNKVLDSLKQQISKHASRAELQAMHRLLLDNEGGRKTPIVDALLCEVSTASRDASHGFRGTRL